MPANPSSTTATATSKAVTDPKTGQSYAAPSYSAFSVKGLTSTDPANVARNREAAAMYASRGLGSGSSGNGGGGGSGILAYIKRRGTDSESNQGGRGGQTQLTSAQLAALGGPSAAGASAAPVEVPTPSYGLASLVPRPDVQPTFNYGQAFANLPPNYSMPQYFNLMDIFNTFPNFGQRG